MRLPILMCIADDTKWLFFRIVPPPSAGEQYTTKLGYMRKKAETDRKSQKYQRQKPPMVIVTIGGFI